MAVSGIDPVWRPLEHVWSATHWVCQRCGLTRRVVVEYGLRCVALMPMVRGADATGGDDEVFPIGSQ